MSCRTNVHSEDPVSLDERHRAAVALAAVARRLYARGWADATSGNFSVRVSPVPLFLITATGRDKATLEPSHVVLVDETGAALAGEPHRPSYETKIHVKTYRATGAGAVLHAHPPHSVALSTALPRGRSTIPLRGLELVKAFAGVSDPEKPLELPVVANDQDMERMSDTCVAARREPVPAVLLQGHGVTVWGKDLDEAVRHLEAVEALAHIIILQKTLGVDPWRSS
jgi:methylthioribulose-1-phosphate dehydratase